MSKEGHQKRKATIEAKYGQNYWVELGRKGGKKPGHLTSERAKEMAAKRWGKKTVDK